MASLIDVCEEKMNSFTFTTEHEHIMPKPVMSYKDKWNRRPCVTRWFSWKDCLSESYLNNNGMEYFSPVNIQMDFKIKDGRKLDLDNLIKGVIDALCKLAFKDDDINHIKRIEASVERIDKNQIESCEISINEIMEKES